ncbi:DoxX family protein [Streptomyces sp. JUS-F4]|uniref:MauE/DoxX family redox-associated membrane protein n=1 Tax=Streptomyces TaxID=1883 RepID=UPI001F2A4184|nr:MULTISPECIES: MauE/DoxX family redox-associated membrane protein [Streptomyces]WKN12767.1 DoxX family protein [Streptomyces sp. JUS-F4]WKN19259.1 DoxX family protein [Streptomyces sp. JUS-F4]
MSFITLMARGALAGVWFWAGWAKILDPVASAESVRAHRILSEAQISSFVYGLPALELVLAALLWAGLSIRLAAVMSALLLLAFLATIVVAWGSGRSIGCGCFGHGGEIDATDAHYLQEVLRDVGLLFLCAWLTKWPASNFSVDADLR